jgi:uncharacterized protein (DUF1501 family)
MKRRDFFAAAGSSFFLPVLLDGGFGAKALSPTSPFMQTLFDVAQASDRILVVIQLNGGNDGINTVIPLDQMDVYNRANMRQSIAIPEGRVLKLNGNNGAGFHPAMTAMQRMYNDGELVLIQGVTYPQPNLSHFRASDIWFTASDANQSILTGWLGRYLDNRFPRYPQNYPNPQMTDPLAIQIGAIPSTAFLGSATSMTVVLQNPDTFARLVGDRPNVPDNVDVPAGYAGQRISFIRQQQISTVAYAAQIRRAAERGRNIATYPTGNSLADQLRIVARLIHGGLQTKVYYVSIGGFDTHAAQVDANDTTIGAHANLWRNVSEGIGAFQNDLKQQGTDNKVVGMTFSEFGRTVAANGTRGTDHGSAAPQFVFGKNLKGGMIGRSPSLTDLENGRLKMQFDFRQIYSTLLRDWFGTARTASNEVMMREFGTLPIFNDIVTAFDDKIYNEKNLTVYPNPTSAMIVVESEALATSAGAVRVVDTSGRELMRRNLMAGQRRVQLDVSKLPAGNYVVQLEAGQKGFTSQLAVVH